jgi:hypothetical protein
MNNFYNELNIGSNSTVRILEIGWNNIKQIGAVAISRGLVVIITETNTN